MEADVKKLRSIYKVALRTLAERAWALFISNFDKVLDRRNDCSISITRFNLRSPLVKIGGVPSVVSLNILNLIAGSFIGKFGAPFFWGVDIFLIPVGSHTSSDILVNLNDISSEVNY